MDLHIFFLPFLSPGHMIPMVDLAKIFACRGVKVTIVTTTANVPLIQPTIDCSPQHIQLLTIRFPSSESGLPEGHENLTALPTPEVTSNFADAIDNLKDPFEQLLKEHRPDCLVSDMFYPWTTELASDIGIPRLVFHGTGNFPCTVMGIISYLKPHENVAGETEPFVVPGVPHQFEMMKSQLPDFLKARSDWSKFVDRMAEAQQRSYGNLMNSFYELEPEYADMLKGVGKVWHVGPVSLCNRDTVDRAARGRDNASVTSWDYCLNWLDNKKPASVLYMCFGSLGQFTCSQLREMALGLEASDHPFIWVVRNEEDSSEWMPEGFEERMVGQGKGMIIRGWMPQILVLNHEAVGGFVTHCGWNSCLEGVSAGVPMITWPLFAEQFFNERLIVDVLRIGIAIGVKVCSHWREEWTAIKGAEIKKSVDELMGGEEADGRRKRARELAEKARRAVEDGGSSHNYITCLIQDLMDFKTARESMLQS